MRASPTMLLALSLLVQACAALQVGSPSAFSVHITSHACPLARTSAPRCQFGGDEEPKGLTRDAEPEDYFSTNMGVYFAPQPQVKACSVANIANKMSDAEKLKSPAVIGGVALLVLPFLVGLIALAAAQ
eukprot:6201511-Pleurochrysis_carterae.AAC.3